MNGREQLLGLANAYLKFLITRDFAGLKPFLSLDFSQRLLVSQQLKLIQGLPATFAYGIGPEAHLWREYVAIERGKSKVLTPFQFDVTFRNLNNPLVTETMTVTIHEVICEGGEWKITSVLCENDHSLLRDYAGQSTVSVAAKPSRHIQPE